MYESVCDWGACIWVLGDLKLIIGSFMGFGVGFKSVGLLQGDLWVLGVFGGFFRGLRAVYAIFMIVIYIDVCDIKNKYLL